ncbi:anthranilate synthase component I [Derxia lacustris]|uniref:anthranilate synthase component I n=1 Tax=Derxia lacustris TaxID=764842 RepID=UPI000A176655|nr:anthranilate synthase component I [Derxia lacustris]
MTEIEFNAIAAEGYNRIPVLLECFADLDTPLSLYLKLAHDPSGRAHSFLLESVVGGERFGRYSFIGLPARTVLRARGDTVEVVTDGKVVETHSGNPLDFVAEFKARFKVALRPGLPRFAGGLAGYFGYDCVRYMEPRLARHAQAVHPAGKPDALDVPDILLLLTEELVIVDNLAGKTYMLVYANPAEPEAFARAKARLRELHASLRKTVGIPYSKPSMQTEIRRDFAKDDFKAMVLKAKEYIAVGDLMQVVLGQVLRKPFRDSPLTLYRALRSLNPSPYMFFYDFGDFQVVGASPEILVREEKLPGDRHSKVVLRPIAGTRPRGNTPDEDERLAAEMAADPKEVAEHVMLIDLARNDIGRIAETGSVVVTERFATEKYSHVQHMVSNVEGRLKPGLSNLDVLKATFPAGTLSGAPKVRAMELIEELEPVKRGVYGGAVGYLSFGGEMDLAIAIRTGVVKDGMLHVQAGAGIVADSDPESEWKETEAKARAVLRAAEQVQEGLDERF